MQDAYAEKCLHYEKLVRRLVNQKYRLETMKDNLLDTANMLSGYHEVLQVPELENLLYVRDGLSEYSDSFYNLHGGELIEYFLSLISIVQVDLE